MRTVLPVTIEGIQEFPVGNSLNFTLMWNPFHIKAIIHSSTFLQEVIMKRFKGLMAGILAAALAIPAMSMTV